jgi:pyruvate/2-oxoglutarate dehydrogenase complex dihydrolipoamide dehydrogenase (E3) component
MLADLIFPSRQDGRADEIRGARCYHCYPGMPEIPGDNIARLVPDMVPTPQSSPQSAPSLKCTINPVAGNQIELEKMPAPQGSRKVLVIGGGPAGLQAAITAADRGHQVTLVEKNGSLGGILYYTSGNPHKIDLYNFWELLKREVSQRHIQVKLNTEATPDFIKAFRYAVTLAIGGHLQTGDSRHREGLARSQHLVKGTISARFIILGCGLAGCETGLHLADQGHQVTIVEMQDRLAPESFGLELTATIRQIQQRPNIIVKTGWQCIEMSERSAKLKNAAGSEEVLAGDTVCSFDELSIG